MFDLGFGYDTGKAIAGDRARSKMQKYIEEHPGLSSSERETLLKAAEDAGKKEYEEEYNRASNWIGL